jgi:hypothetical protein
MTRRAVIAFACGIALALGFGWAAFPRLLYVRAAQPLAFSHKTHTAEAVGLSCEDCHSLRADGSFTGIPRIGKCAECHGSPMGESAEERQLVEQYVTPGKEIPWAVYARQPDNVHFPHAQHVKRAGMKCEECHGDHGSTSTLRPHETNRVSGYSRDIWGASMLRVGRKPGQGMKMSDCEGCHAERRSHGTACLDCHK